MISFTGRSATWLGSPSRGGRWFGITSARRKLSAGRDQAGLPSGRPSARRRVDRVHGEAGSGKQPGDYGVRVPHLTGPELVSAPDEARHGTHEIEEAVRPPWVVGQPLRSAYCLVRVGDHPVPPPAHLVPKRAEAGHPAAPDRAFNDHAARRRMGIRDRPRVLDDEASLRHAHLERGVEEVERASPFAECLDGLVDSPVQANEPTPCSQGDPVQVDAGLPVQCDAPLSSPIDASARSLMPFSIFRSMMKAPGSLMAIQKDVASDLGQFCRHRLTSLVPPSVG